jgi:hypothetical protein
MLAQEVGGAELGDASVRHRSGSWLDPELTRLYLRHRSELWPSEDDDMWRDTLAEEPAPVRALPRQDLSAVAAAFADLADLKSPFLHGHARAVASLVEAAGRELGLANVQRESLERAALLHDIGRVAVPTSIWEKPGPLTELEWEQVRQHPYHTERILSRAPAFSDAARIAALHHERLDGGGYHRQLPASLQPMLGRVLAAADVLAALLTDRPHRPAFSERGGSSRARGGGGEWPDRSGRGRRRPGRPWPAAPTRRAALARRTERPRGRGSPVARRGPIEA